MKSNEITRIKDKRQANGGKIEIKIDTGELKFKLSHQIKREKQNSKPKIRNSQKSFFLFIDHVSLVDVSGALSDN